MYTHYSHFPHSVWNFDKNRKYFDLEEVKNLKCDNDIRKFLQEPKRRCRFKPDGLWLGIDDSWRTWCKAENFNHKGKFLNIVDIKDTKLLKLSGEQEILAFTEKYKIPILPNVQLHSSYIKWNEIYKEYDGIEISPYCWECRLAPETMWYYTFDVSCACIWNCSKLEVRRATKEEKLQLIEMTKEALRN